MMFSQHPGIHTFLLSFSVLPLLLAIKFVLYDFLFSTALDGLQANPTAWKVALGVIPIAMLFWASLPALVSIISFFRFWLVQGSVLLWWDKILGVLSLGIVLISLLLGSLRFVHPGTIL